MQSVRADISPKPVETNLLARSLCSSHLEDTGSDAQGRVSCDNLGARYPLCNLASLTRCELCSSIEVASILCIYRTDLLACTIS